MPQKILFNWRLRVAYLLFAAGMGWAASLGGELPVSGAVAALVAMALLRMVLEGRGA